MSSSSGSTTNSTAAGASGGGGGGLFAFETLMRRVNTQHGLTILLTLSLLASVAFAFALFWLLLSMEKQTLLDSYQDLMSGAGGDNGESSSGGNRRKKRRGRGSSSADEQDDDDDDGSMTSSSYVNMKGELELEIEMSEIGKHDGAGNSYASVVEIEEETGSPKGGGGEDGIAMASARQARMRLSLFRKLVLAFLTLLLVCMTSLLLVYSSAPAFVSVVGWVLICFFALLGQILEELRRQRCDRLVAVATVLLLLASSLNLTTYSSIAVSQENLYQGPARIVGYDTSRYSEWKKDNNNNKSGNNNNRQLSKNDWSDTQRSRTDLQVQWGGRWGCPLTPGKQCKADVQGALCERDDTTEGQYDDDAAYDTSETSAQEQLYYDKDGNVVDAYADEEDLFDADGNPVERENDTDTTVYDGSTGKQTKDNDSYQDTEYATKNGTTTVKEETTYEEDSSKTQEDSTEVYQSYDDSGKPKETDTYTYDETYNDNGSVSSVSK